MFIQWVGKMVHTSKQGMSLVYVMLCLIIIGFTTTALIKMSHKNAITQIQYSNSESARIAVKSGFDFALSKLESKESDDQKEILKTLQAWIDSTDAPELNNPHRWLVGSQNSYDTLEDNSFYRVQILGFDSSDFAISLLSEGLNKNGTKASAMGTYYLDGLGFAADTSQGIYPTNALHLGQGAGEIIAPLKIMRGDTWVDNPKSYFAGAGIPHEFHGLFMTSNNGGNTMQIKSAIFHETAFIRCPIKIDGNSFIVKKGIGLEQDINTTQPVTVEGGDFYFNGNYKTTGAGAATAGVHLYNNADAYVWSAQQFNSSSITSGVVEKDATPHEINGETDRIVNMKSRLGITKQDPPEISVDISKIPASYRYEASTISGNSPLTANHLNTAYKNKALWNDFLVITGNPYVHNSVSSLGTLDCKVIWILENAPTLVSNTQMFTMSSNALMMLYLGNTKVDYFKLPETFRGFIYSDGAALSAAKHIFQGSQSEVHGGILIKDRTFRLESNGGNFEVYYDSTIINAFSELGLFVLEGDVDTVDTDQTLVLTKEKIDTELLSRSF